MQIRTPGRKLTAGQQAALYFARKRRVARISENAIQSEWFLGAGAPDDEEGVALDWYLNVSNGDVYQKDSTSSWGSVELNIKGPTGDTGPEGPEVGGGEDFWFLGTGAPDNDDGSNYDYYLDVASGDIWRKDDLVNFELEWALTGDNIKGPDGDQGPEGPEGGS